MEVHDTHIPDEEFSTFLEQMPQVCVELVVESTQGVLLGKRTSKPKRWFWPGGRLYKGEQLEEAVHRIADEELGIDVAIHELLGAQSHYWEPDETRTGVSRHTVNLVYHVCPATDDFTIELDDQHSDYRFVSTPDPDFHEYVREYFTAFELPRGTC